MAALNHWSLDEGALVSPSYLLLLTLPPLTSPGCIHRGWTPASPQAKQLSSCFSGTLLTAVLSCCPVVQGQAWMPDEPVNLPSTPVLTLPFSPCLPHPLYSSDERTPFHCRRSHWFFKCIGHLHRNTHSQIWIKTQVNFKFVSHCCPRLVGREGEDLTEEQEFRFHVFNTSGKVQ